MDFLRLHPKVRMRMETPLSLPLTSERCPILVSMPLTSGAGPVGPQGNPPSVGVLPAFALSEPLTCSRVARERTAPGPAPQLPQLFLFLLPPRAALSHGRGAEAQTRDGRAPGAPTPAPSGPGRQPGGEAAALAAAESATSADSTCSWRGERPGTSDRLPRLLLAAHPASFSLLSLSHSLPPSPPRRLGAQERAGSAGPRLLGEGLPATEAVPQPHTLEPPARWTKTNVFKINKQGRGRWPGLFLPFHSIPVSTGNPFA